MVTQALKATLTPQKEDFAFNQREAAENYLSALRSETQNDDLIKEIEESGKIFRLLDKHYEINLTSKLVITGKLGETLESFTLTMRIKINYFKPQKTLSMITFLRVAMKGSLFYQAYKLLLLVK